MESPRDRKLSAQVPSARVHIVYARRRDPWRLFTFAQLTRVSHILLRGTLAMGSHMLIRRPSGQTILIDLLRGYQRRDL